MNHVEPNGNHYREPQFPEHRNTNSGFLEQYIQEPNDYILAHEKIKNLSFSDKAELRKVLLLAMQEFATRTFLLKECVFGLIIFVNRIKSLVYKKIL